MGQPTKFLLLATLALLTGGCGGTPTAVAQVVQVTDSGATYVPGTAWRSANPAALGFDAARLQAMTRDVSNGRYGVVHGVIVVRYGWVATEHYAGWSATAPHTMQSVTKSVTSLLYGIATAGGTSAPGRLDRPVLDLFSRFAPVANSDARKSALTVRDLLAMRTSMDFYEQPYAGSPLAVLNASSGDWTRYILDRPMVGAPGTTWAYNSGAAILIGSAIRELTGEHADAFARRELFAPIGVTGETWARSPFDGLPHTGGGLNLKPMDLARVGYLVLRGGRWGERQIVPRAWLDSSTRAITRGPPVYFSNDGSGYGYFWWTFPTRRGGSDAGIIAGSGSGGQWLFVVPSLDLVVAIVAGSGNGLDLLYNGVLPALRSP
jgi:CubicO group peptidase (beta-lactamase class C family)